MIASTQITTTEIFAFIAVLVFKLFFIVTEKAIQTALLFKQIADFTGKLLQNYK